ncbi:Uncharacterized protein YloV [Geodia barretti]|uniref:Uncharacterized protein YloV n=1 Tax=Geodia barretti TaxID=519541 RepID=A0AA35S9S5_GEOBA|nr:Uncharacterized protein YloV [Geodia barretti]
MLGETGPAADLGLRSVGGVINPHQTESVAIDSDFLDAHEAEEFGYCTQFVIHGQELNVDELRSGFAGIADSTVIVGGGQAVRIHVHTADPGSALTYGVGFGELDELKIDNMSLQNRDWAAGHRERARPAEIRSGVSVIAVASGRGLADLFQDAGCAAIIPGGQTLNPSASEIIDAAMSAGTTDVIVLPNNHNVILTANQAAEADTGEIRLHVLATRTMPQGTGALLGFNPEVSVDDNLANMESARGAVETLEVTQAVRDSVVDGREVREGEYMAILDGKLAALTATPDAAAASQFDDGAVTVIDCGTASVGHMLQVIAAAEDAVAEDATLESVVSAAGSRAGKGYGFAMVDTLEYLQKGGRIGKAQAFMGSLLKVKPILKVADGEVLPVDRPRNVRRGLQRLEELVREQGPVSKLAVAYTTDAGPAEEMRNRLSDLADSANTYTLQIGSAIGTHVGPGAVAVSTLP